MDMVLNKEYITLSRKGDIMQLGAIVGTYTKHIPSKRYWGGRQLKLVPYYYSVELFNGKSFGSVSEVKNLAEMLELDLYCIENADEFAVNWNDEFYEFESWIAVVTIKCK